jgi:hypothetical protein
MTAHPFFSTSPLLAAFEAADSRAERARILLVMPQAEVWEHRERLRMVAAGEEDLDAAIAAELHDMMTGRMADGHAAATVTMRREMARATLRDIAKGARDV